MHIDDVDHSVNQDEIHGYIEAYRDIMNPNAFETIEEIILEDNPSLSSLFSDLRTVIIYSENILENIPEPKKGEVIEAYTNLRDLLDENNTSNEENSLWYYLLKEETELKKTQVDNEIQMNIDTLKRYLKR